MKHTSKEAVMLQMHVRKYDIGDKPIVVTESIKSYGRNVLFKLSAHHIAIYAIRVNELKFANFS